MIEDIIKLIDAYWKFDENQYPMSSWHDKQDLIEAVQQVKNCDTPAVVGQSEQFTCSCGTPPAIRLCEGVETCLKCGDILSK